MNRHQKAVVVIAALNLLLLLLFPPFLDNPLQRGAMRSFEGFYFVLMAPAGRIIHQELLTIEMFFVFANVLAAWLALNKDGAEIELGEAAALRGLALFGIANAAVLLLFPPFQPYPSMVRVPPEGFDGFYFVFGDKRNRQFFMPFLYLELILVAVNVLITWLVFGLLRGTVSAADHHLIEELHHIPPEKADAIVHEIEAVAHPPAAERHILGRKEERRKWQDPNYRGPERRKGIDRRHDKPKA
jgi:hypothetical protein